MVRVIADSSLCHDLSLISICYSQTAARGKNYVDIFNQGSTAKPNNLPPPSQIFDPLPSNNAMPTNFFIPQGGR